MAWHDQVKTGLAAPVLGGFLALALGFGGFGAWAAMAPLEGAVVAPGKVVASGRNKIVQHLEGGIVERVLVAEGQAVRAGEPLLLLDGTAAKAQVSRLGLQLLTLEAIEARAVAERDGLETVALPQALLESGEPDVVRLVDDQRAGFAAALRRHRTELAIFEQQITALEEAIAGHERQKEATRQQIALVVEEREGLETLLDEGLTRKGQVLALKRAEAELTGKESQLSAAAAEGRRSIAEIRERIERAGNQRVEEAAARVMEARLKRSEVSEQLRAAADVVRRLAVLAPAAGTVMELAKYHPGAVVAPGQDLLTIVPEGSGLLVEALVRPRDIAEVAVGQDAWLQFPALHAEAAPPVPARVVYISADRIEDRRTGDVHYLARLEIAPESAAGFDPARIGPGNGADVFIATGERTFLSYVTEPLMRTIRRSMRES